MSPKIGTVWLKTFPTDQNVIVGNNEATNHPSLGVMSKTKYSTNPQISLFLKECNAHNMV